MLEPGIRTTRNSNSPKVLTYNPGSQPFFATYVDDQPLSTCCQLQRLNPNPNVPFASTADTDAGSSFTVKRSERKLAGQGESGSFMTTLNAAGTFLSPGTYTVTGAGGADIGPISANVTIPPSPTLVSPLLNNVVVTRTNGMTVTWTPNGATGIVQIQVTSALDNTNTTGASVICTAPATAGTFTIPSYALLTLPTGSFGGLSFQQMTPEVPFTATGLSLGILQASGVHQLLFWLQSAVVLTPLPVVAAQSTEPLPQGANFIQTYFRPSLSEKMSE